MINSIDKVNEWLRTLGLVDITKLEASFLIKEIGEEVAEELKCELFELFLGIIEVRLKNGDKCTFKQSDLEYLSKIEECQSKDFSSFFTQIYVLGVEKRGCGC